MIAKGRISSLRLWYEYCLCKGSQPVKHKERQFWGNSTCIVFHFFWLRLSSPLSSELFQWSFARLPHTKLSGMSVLQNPSLSKSSRIHRLLDVKMSLVRQHARHSNHRQLVLERLLEKILSLPCQDVASVGKSTIAQVNVGREINLILKIAAMTPQFLLGS